MNTDEHGAAPAQPKTISPRRSSLGAHASSVPWVSDILHAGCVRSQEPAEKNPWQLAKDFRLRVHARISWHFGASAGQADARRRDAGDVMTSSRSGNAADTRLSPPRPAGLRPPRPAIFLLLLVMIQLGMEAAAKCQIILARALSSTDKHRSSVNRQSSAVNRQPAIINRQSP